MHKKFNSGYSHKKLGLCLKRRDSVEDVASSETITRHEDIASNSKSNLFRAYTQYYYDDSSCQQPFYCSAHYYLATQTAKDYASRWLYYYLQVHPSIQQSEEEYALKLQRQRTALFMKYILQFYETGNGWPSVHPNVRRHNNNFKS